MKFILFCLVVLQMSVIAQTNTNSPPQNTQDQAERIQLDLANGFLSRRFYDLALAEYQKYLEWFPTGSFVEEVKYRMADCFRESGKLDEAREQYQKVQKAFPKGAFFARASFRLGEMDWNHQRFEDALKKFNEAANTAESSETHLTARFYQSRTLLQLQRKQEAVPFLDELAHLKKANPYRPFALLELGKIAESTGHTENAKQLFSQVLETDASPLLLAEAGIKVGELEMKAYHWSSAAKIFEKIRKLPVPDKWIAEVNVQLVRAYYQNNQCEAVVRILSDPQNHFPPIHETEIILLHAHALRLLKQYEQAIAKYDLFLQKNANLADRQIESQKEGYSLAEDASYQRLLCLYTMNASSWDQEATTFLKHYPQAAGISQVLYLQADRAFRKEDFKLAASLYASISVKKFKPDLLPEVIYRHGLSLAKIGQSSEAVLIFTDFIKRFPGHSLLANVLFQRALAEQANRNFEAALRSLQELIKEFPKAPEREAALYRMGLFQGELKNYTAMRKAFDQLNKEYPKTTFFGETTYWTGWSFFEQKQYLESLPYLRKARDKNRSIHGMQSTSRIILALYYLEQRVPLLKELDELPKDFPPPAPEIEDWLARQSAKENDHQTAERYFRKLLKHPEAIAWQKSARWGLAVSLAAQSKWNEAIEWWEAYQKDYPEPSEVIATKLELVHAHTATHDFVRAQEIAEEVLRLQPEGKNNAEARFLLGEMMFDQKKYSEAAKYFLSVAVLYEDPKLTPQSLTRAVECFETVGDTNQVLQLQQELKNKYPNYK